MKRSSEKFLIGAELPSVAVDGGLDRKLMGYNEELMLLEIKFKAGSIGYVHQHKHAQSSYVVSGVFEVTIDGEKRILKAGDGFFVESNVPHGASCIEEGILIDSFSPMREDFLPKE